LLQKLQIPPNIHPTAFVAPTATAIGDVIVEADASLWFGAVLRGDTDTIRIGERTNIQDNVVIHADPGAPCSIGSDCVIGHTAIVHGATVSHHVLIGMHATVLNHAQIGEYSIIGANAMVPQGMIIPPYSLVLGTPAKIVKSLGPEVEEQIQNNVDEYVLRAKAYKIHFNQ
jgi:carbonic anhydrase/acetyltransferase-like protein (isoleucine patch superfamily)